MNLKVVVAALLIAVVPVYAKAQSPSAPKVNKGDAQKVVAIISGDEAFCDMKKLAEQIEEASANKDSKTVSELSQKIVTLEKTLGPEYLALIDGFEDIAKGDQLGAEFESLSQPSSGYVRSRSRKSGTRLLVLWME
jgi:hypothetical protein